MQTFLPQLSQLFHQILSAAAPIDLTWNQGEMIGEDRVRQMYPFGDVIKSGAVMGFGVDWPVGDPNPFPAIEISMTRTAEGFPERGTLGEDQEITVEDAVAALTINGAWLQGFDKITGSIEEGKFADFVIVNQNIFEIPVNEISETKVLQTYFQGNNVYDSNLIKQPDDYDELVEAIQGMIDEEYIIDIKQSEILEKDKTNQPSIESSLAPPDESFLSAMEVTISSGDLTEPIVIDTFSAYNYGKDSTILGQLKKLGFEHYFVLESLPSKDKVDFYKLMSKYINPGKKPQLFDVKITGIMSDGSKLISLVYEKCQATEFSLYSQNLSLIHQFSREKEHEIRDHTLFYCGGDKITEIFESQNLEDDKETDSIPVYPVAHKNDRVQSYIVHFFDGELEELYTFNTFKDFSPSVNTRANPYALSTEAGNPFGSQPRFYLESLPSKDKKEFYELLSRYINPVKVPEKFNVSVDAITGDGTILQRWNYEKCDVDDYKMNLEEYKFRFHFSGEDAPEILEKTDFRCSGLNFKVFGHDNIDTAPVYAKNAINTKDYSIEKIDLTQEDRAMSFRYHVFRGEFTDTTTLTDYPKFESLSFKRSQKTPANHPGQYDFGFYVESSPSKERTDDYQFYSRYINPGKPPEEYDVTVDVVTGDDTILYQLKYAKCSAVDYDWYVQHFVFWYDISNAPAPELRERYTHYCTGFRVDVP